VLEDDKLPLTIQATFGDDWKFEPIRGCFQADGHACGVWLGVARDIYIRYVDSDQYGTGTFETYLQAELNREGVHDLDKCHGSAIRKQRKANQTFILEQRAEMRARLLQLAMEGKLEYGQAELDGFGPS